jgi:hypothetical protein
MFEFNTREMPPSSGSWRGPISRISRLASLRSAPTLARSRPISRRTTSVRAMPSCGTPSNSWQPAARRPTPYRSAGKASVVATLNQNVSDRPRQLPGTPTIPGTSRNPRLSMLRYYKFESKWGGRPPLLPSPLRIGSAGQHCYSMRDRHDPNQDRPRYRKECFSGSRCRRQGHGCHSQAATVTRHSTVLCFSAILPDWH